MNVLIVRPDGIGDVVLSLPVATQLRDLIPGVTVGFLTSPTVAPVLDHHTDVDYVRTLRWTDSLATAKGAFADIDTAIFLKPFRRLMWAAFLARVPARVASGYRWYSLLANRRIYEHRSDFSKHESEYNIEMLQALRVAPQPVRPPRLEVTESEQAAAEERWGDLPHPRVIVHPGGISARRWKPEHFRDLAHELTARQFGVAFTGSQEERARFQQEALGGAEASLPCVLNQMGRLSIRELMGMIATADVVVSGATGPAHLAAALGTATVSLFDPRRNNLPIRWKPLGRGVLLRPNVPTCEKCIGEACPVWDCLDRLTVRDVSTQVQQAAIAPSALSVLHI